MRSSGRLPIKTIKKNTGIPRKSIERHRIYIVTAVEILDGEKILEGLDLENKDIDEVNETILTRLNESGYLNGEEGEVYIATAAKDQEKATKLAEKLRNEAEETTVRNQIRTEVSSEAVGYEMVQKAKEIEGMTPGKYNILTNLLQKSDEEAESYVDTPVKDLMKEFAKSKKIGDSDDDDRYEEDEDEDDRDDDGDDDDRDDERNGQKPDKAGKPENVGRSDDDDDRDDEDDDDRDDVEDEDDNEDSEKDGKPEEVKDAENQRPLNEEDRENDDRDEDDDEDDDDEDDDEDDDDSAEEKPETQGRMGPSDNPGNR